MIKKLFNFKISADQERQWEKKHILKLKNEYLNTDVLIKYQNDLGYRLKIDLIKKFLNQYKTDGYILDIGSNTCGESEILNYEGIVWLLQILMRLHYHYQKKIQSLEIKNDTMLLMHITFHLWMKHLIKLLQ